MDSPALSKPGPLSRLLPVAAIYGEDLGQATRHWAFVAWLGLGLALAVYWLARPHGMIVGPTVEPPDAPMVAHVSRLTSSQVTAKLIGVQVLLLFSLAMALAASAIVAEAEMAADAILCRGVARWQYYFGKLAARLTVAFAAFLLTVLPAVLIASLRLDNDLTRAGLLTVLGESLAVLASVVGLSIAISVLFRNPLLSVVSVWMLVLGAGVVLTILDASHLSPVIFVDRFAAQLRGEMVVLPTSLPTLVASVASIATAISLFHYCRKDL